jgi:hypothetical protein
LSGAPQIELIANIFTIAAALIFVVSIGWFFLRFNASLLNSRSSIQKGTKIMVPDVNWSTSPASAFSLWFPKRIFKESDERRLITEE